MSNKTKLIIKSLIDLFIIAVVWLELLGSNIETWFAVCMAMILTSYIVGDILDYYSDYKDGKEIKLLPISFKFNFKFNK